MFTVNNLCRNIKLKGLFIKASFFILILACFFPNQAKAQKSNDKVLILNTDSFQLFFIKPIEFKSGKNESVYDISLIENKPACVNEYVLRIALISKKNVGKLTTAQLCFPEYKICFEEFKLLNFEVKKGKFRYRLEYQINKEILSKYIDDDTIQFRFLLNNQEFELENKLKMDDQQLIKVVIQNGTKCDLL
jgi:hypothetical protein